MDANIHEIYNILLTGKSIQLDFSSQEMAESFRVKLAKFKSRQDKLLEGLGFQGEDEKQKLTFQIQTQLHLTTEQPIMATLSFKDRDVKQTFSIKVVEDG